MKFVCFLIFFFLGFIFFLFSVPKNIYAASAVCTEGCWLANSQGACAQGTAPYWNDPVSGLTFTCWTDPSTGNNYDCNSTSGALYYATCNQNNPQDYCDTSTWTFYYNPQCSRAVYDTTYANWGNSTGTADCAWQSNNCSTADRCQDSSPGVNNVPLGVPGPAGGGGTGTNTQGIILPGICDLSNVSVVNGQVTNPNAACVSGGFYKTCCPGTAPSNTCLNGSCPYGQITGPNVTTCPSTPTPTPTANGYNCVNNSSCQASTNGPGTYSTLSGCQAACGTSCPTYAPPPPTQPVSCPSGTTCTANGTAQTVQTGCSPTGSQCSPSCSLTCIDSQGHTCPSTSCSTVWACQGSQWYNGGQYYFTCPSSCPNCTIGATQTTCGPTSVCHAP